MSRTAARAFPRTTNTLEPRRFNDDWSFHGRGRKLYAHSVPQRRTLILEADGPPREEAPVGPGEPRG